MKVIGLIGQKDGGNKGQWKNEKAQEEMDREEEEELSS